jgi:hypothetical protein
MDKLYLIYINVVGMDWTGMNIYEFIFSDSIENVDGEDWDAIPASGRPSPPNESNVKRVGVLNTKELSFHVVQESDSFSVWDAVDGVIALGWENMDTYDEYPENRLAFHFGDDMKVVIDKLYEQDLTLEFNKVKHEKK